MALKIFFKRSLDRIFGDSTQGHEREERIKFFIKWTFLGFLGRTFVLFFGTRPNRDGWEDRILIMGSGGIGDVIMATPSFRYYRKYFSGKRLYLLVTEHSGIQKSMFGGLIDEVVTFDGNAFQSSPWYKLKIINRLRAIGFAQVINETTGAKDIPSKVISISLGARSVTGYEGPGVELANPVAAPFERYAERHINPHYTTLVRSIDRDFKEKKSHPKSAILHHLEICTAVTGITEFSDVSTVFHVDEEDVKSAREKLARLGAKGGKYVVFVVSCVDAARRWEVEKFLDVARFVRGRGFDVVVMGSPSQKMFSDYIDITGKFSPRELNAAIKGAHCLISNDTGLVHIAVALTTPVICIPTCGHLAMNSLYGREKIDRWVFKDVGCLYDDARCAATVPLGDPAPCVQAVAADDVIAEFSSLENYRTGHPTRDEAFVTEFMGTPNYHENIH